jgi:hypothetical protein
VAVLLAAEGFGAPGGVGEPGQERVGDGDAEFAIEEGDLESFGALLAPEGGGHLVDEAVFDFIGGAEAAEVSFQQALEFGCVFA